MNINIGFDFETERMTGQKVIPPVICLAVYCLGAGDVRAHCEPEFDDIIDCLLNGDDTLIAHNAAFDLAVMCFYNPKLLSRVWKMVCDDRRVRCTIIREKLLNLTSHGNLDFIPNPDGTNSKLFFKLETLVLHHLGIDISEHKDDNDDWRTNYSELRALRAQDYPDDARDYVLADARYAHDIFNKQEAQAAEQIKTTGVDPFATQHFRVAVDFALTLMSAWGMATDPVMFHKIEAMLKEALKPENTALLVEAGILRPEQPERPYANGARNPDGTAKMVKGKPESVDTKVMRAHLLTLKKAMPDDVELRRTKPSERFPKGQLSYDAPWQDDHFHLCPIIEQFRDRSKLQKLVTTELPRMMMLDDQGERTDVLSPVVHPCFDVLKKTGRISSYGGKLYPSFNCQNVDPRVRGCYVPREGFVLLSADYSQMELATLAQTNINLFGKSVMADKINAGCDLHAFLGASIAYNTDIEFKRICDDAGVATPDDIYAVFIALKTADDQKVRKFFKHYRTLAKPTGLGYPGGLMPQTFIKYAKASYGIVIDLDTATLLRNVWLRIFPEMERYFNHINEQCEDTRNSPRIVKFFDDDGNEKTRKQKVFAYSTPLGLYRAGCDYCAASNGIGLQSPAAEGALMGLLNVSRACYDPDMGSILYDDVQGPTCRPVAFIHDEILCEIRNDTLMTERAEAIEKIMVDAMRIITPDVAARTEVALMERWDKAAESERDLTGQLKIWKPQETP